MAANTRYRDGAGAHVTVTQQSICVGSDAARTRGSLIKQASEPGGPGSYLENECQLTDGGAPGGRDPRRVSLGPDARIKVVRTFTGRACFPLPPT